MVYVVLVVPLFVAVVRDSRLVVEKESNLQVMNGALTSDSSRIHIFTINAFHFQKIVNKVLSWMPRTLL
jgi:hypothetical protein